MMRTRLVSFAFGFAVAGAAISHFVWRDLLANRNSLSSEVNQKFDALEARISKLESFSFQKLESTQVNQKVDTLEARISNLESLCFQKLESTQES